MAAVLGPDVDIAKPSREVEHRQIRPQHFGHESTHAPIYRELPETLL
jgi:hypothetical protein